MRTKLLFVITTRIGGNPSVIEENKDGLLINPGDIQSLSSKILYLLENSEEALCLAENARKKVEEEFNLKKMLNDTIQVFEEALQ
jgi:glycosyltransferase involved in cell wall biosynthesis